MRIVHTPEALQAVGMEWRRQGLKVALVPTMGYYHEGHASLIRYARSVADKVMVVIITDGMENASKEYSLAQVRHMVARQRDRFGWEILFLGANIDAISAAEGIGIRRDRAVKYVQDTAGMELNYRVVSDTICKMRMCEPVGADWKAEIEADEKKRGN